MIWESKTPESAAARFLKRSTGSTCLSPSFSQSRSRQISQPSTRRGRFGFGSERTAAIVRRQTGDVGVVLVRGVVDVEHLGLHRLEDRLEVGADAGVAGLLHVRARVHQLDLAGVLADDRGLALLLDADPDHLRVGAVA